MKIIPVIDLKNGIVVRGVGGQRDNYQPVRSVICGSVDPVDVVRAFVDHFGFESIYLADLDAIAGSKPVFSVYERIRQLGVELWVDYGIRDAGDVSGDIGNAIDAPIVGLETVKSPRALQQIVESSNEMTFTFSLDLKGGQVLRSPDSWGTHDPLAIASRVIGIGIKRLIILDLARVGVGAGIGTEAIAERVKSDFPHVSVIVGGGVSGMSDLRWLQSIGVDGVLVASSLHDGRITSKLLQAESLY